jgi:hypothetical protein
MVERAAFVTGPDPEILQALITYVSEFVPKHSGENYHPHVTTGLAPREYLDKMLKEPFEAFTFSPAGAGRLPPRPLRHGGEGTQRMGFEALATLSILSDI